MDRVFVRSLLPLSMMMMTMMVMFPSIEAASSSGGGTLTSFKALLGGLTTGQQVKAVYNYQLCSSGNSSAPGPDAQGGLVIGTFEYFGASLFGQELLAFSDNQLIRNYFGSSLTKDPHFYDYVKTSVFADGSVRVDVDYISLEGDKVLLSEFFVCQINDGSNKGGVTFYALNSACNS